MSPKTRSSLPRNSLAHELVRLNGWSREDAIQSICNIDQVDEAEAERRYDSAMQQKLNRQLGQRKRQDKRQIALDDARLLALNIAYHRGIFLCPSDLPDIASKAGWGSAFGFESTGRAMREIIDPLEKAGYFLEFRDQNDRFIGYTLTEVGRQKLVGESS